MINNEIMMPLKSTDEICLFLLDKLKRLSSAKELTLYCDDML